MTLSGSSGSSRRMGFDKLAAEIRGIATSSPAGRAAPWSSDANRPPIAGNKAHAAQQAALFPETSPLIDELEDLDVNSLSPIEALNKLFEWQKKYTKGKL